MHASGANTSIQSAGVQYILDSVVDHLLADSSKRFAYAEVAFFSRWWRAQRAPRRAAVRQLVAQRRLVFVNGGWCMHDEAAASFGDMLDQTALGHTWLRDNLNTSARVGWQLDPFGHTALQATLLGPGVGLEAVFMGRTHYADLEMRQRTQALEFRWLPRGDGGDGAGPYDDADTPAFLGMLLGSGNYGPPPGFDWDVSGDPPVNDDPALEGYNADDVADAFADAALAWARRFRGSESSSGGDVMFTMGSDFNYQTGMWWTNLDKLIAALRRGGRVNAFYSTPDAYLDAKRSTRWGSSAGDDAADPAAALPVRRDDLFPYADGAHAYWAGYFSSRPGLKRHARTASAYLAAARQLLLLGGAPAGGAGAALGSLEDAVATAQHHDAVAGTSKQHVADDYSRRLAAGTAAAAPAVAAAASALLGGGVQFSECLALNVSLCSATSALRSVGDAVSVFLWNPLGWARPAAPVRVPVPAGATVRVTGPDGSAVAAQTLPPSDATRRLRALHASNADDDVNGDELVFLAELPALGYALYRMERVAAPAQAPHTAASTQEDDALSSTGDGVALHLDRDGALEAMSLGPLRVSAQASFAVYSERDDSIDGDDSQAGGAYILRPVAEAPLALRCAPPLRGTLVMETRCTGEGGWVEATLRVHARASPPHAELEWTVGPVPIADGVGRSVALRVTTGVATGGALWTDANGRDMQLRRRGAWPANATAEAVASAYFPATAVAAVSDGKGSAFAMLPDRAQGVASLRDGEVEAILHRRLLFDDARGVAEALNETETTPDGHTQGLTVRGVTRLALGAHTTLAATARRVQAQAERPPLMLFAPSAPIVTSGQAVLSRSLLAAPLPEQLQLLTLAPLPRRSALLRLAHGFEANGGPGADAALSRPARIDLGALLAGRRVAAVTELLLSAAAPRPAGSYPRAGAACEDVAAKTVACRGGPVQRAPVATGGDHFWVALGAMEVRAFRLDFADDAPLL
jgi:alpha-mannosidase